MENSRELLVFVLIVVAHILVGALALLFGHIVWLNREARTRRPVLLRAKLIIIGFLDEYVIPEESIQFLKCLSTRHQLRLVDELAPIIGGEQRGHVRRLAEEIGLIQRFESLCHSKRWWNRLHGSRILTILAAGEDIMPSLLLDKSKWVRSQAAEWVADHPNPENIKAVLGLLDDPEAICRFSAQDTLHRLGPSVAGPLIDLFSGDTGPQNELALKVAAEIGSPEFLPTAFRSIEDDSPRIRSLGCQLLGGIGGEAAAQRLVAVTSDPYASVRASALRALGELEHWPAAHAVSRLLGDADWNVRQEAGKTLAKLGAPGRIVLLHAASQDDQLAGTVARQHLELLEESALARAG